MTISVDASGAFKFDYAWILPMKRSRSLPPISLVCMHNEVKYQYAGVRIAHDHVIQICLQ